LLCHGGVGNLVDLATLAVEVVTDQAARDRADGSAVLDPPHRTSGEFTLR
jgi:hypothetical protein